jgi:ribosomal protein S18 acetylase RimI-like enzyme
LAEPPDRPGGAAVVVRPAAEDDLPLLAGWMGAFFEHLKAASGDPYFAGASVPPEAERRALFATALAAGQLLLVASLESVPAGYLLGRTEPPFVRESPIPAVGHVSHCFVAAAARQRGVAGRLIAAAEAWFAARGIRYVELGYLLTNADAAATWPRLGYRPLRLTARKDLAAE